MQYLVLWAGERKIVTEKRVVAETSSAQITESIRGGGGNHY